MSRNVFAIALVLLSSVCFAQATPAPAATGASSVEIATRFIQALDAGNWEVASKEVGAPAARIESSWKDWGSLRGTDKAWAGPPRLETLTFRNGTVTIDVVYFPIIRTSGHMVMKLEVVRGKVNLVNVVPDPALFGPYSKLANKSYTWPDGSKSSWYISASGTSVVAEIRGPTGQLADMQLIKSDGAGSLAMLRSGNCPDGVCGQSGVVQDGFTVIWKEPKASGGYAGNYMEVKMWTEGNALVTFTRDPAPYSGVQIYDQYPEFEYLRPKPITWKLEPIASYTAEQLAESRSKVAAMEPMMQSEVAKALGKQASVAQGFADRRAEKEASSARVQSFNRLMGSVNEVLTEANVVATANEAQSRAELDATIARMNAQAAQQRHQQHASQPGRQTPPAASQPSSAQVAGSATSPAAPAPTVATASGASVGVASPSPAKAAGGPMTFILLASVDAIINRMNGTCFSNLVTIQGPPGWPVLDHSNDDEAARMVAAYIPGFEASCRQAGATRSTSYVWNARGSEGRPAEEQARHKRNRMFEVQVSP